MKTGVETPFQGVSARAGEILGQGYGCVLSYFPHIPRRAFVAFFACFSPGRGDISKKPDRHRDVPASLKQLTNQSIFLTNESFVLFGGAAIFLKIFAATFIFKSGQKVGRKWAESGFLGFGRPF